MKKINIFLIVLFTIQPLYAEINDIDIKQIMQNESAEIQVKNLNKYFILNFKKIRTKCESKLQNVLLGKVKSTSDRDKVTTENNKLKHISPVLSRSGCLAKFRLEMEKIIYGSFSKKEESIMFNKILSYTLSKSEKDKIIQALSMPHDNWITKNIKSINKKNTNIRNQKFNQLIEILMGFFINIPALGCYKKKNEEQFYCS